MAAKKNTRLASPPSRKQRSTRNGKDVPPYRNVRLPLQERLADLLKRMTLEEKACQLYARAQGGPPVNDDGTTAPERIKNLPNGLAYTGRVGLRRSPADSARAANTIQQLLLERTRLGIPALIIDEALHGLMARQATCYPQAIALASTWDTELVHRVFQATAAEMRARGGTLAYSPVLDVARDPRWGRTEETYGEDPFLVSRMGYAAVTGLQGTGKQRFDKQHVMATAKHFAAYGIPEGGINFAPGNVSERVLREELLEPFRTAVVEAGIGCVMASYNEIDGLPSHVNSWLLQTVLRHEWKYDGLLVSDGGGLKMLVEKHRVAENDADAAVQALDAGIQMEMGNCFSNLPAQCKAGRVTAKQIEQAAASVLRAKFRLGLFDDPFVDPEAADRICECEEHRALALEAARKALVLLKNEAKTLPLKLSKLKTIAVIGPNAKEAHTGGYSGESSFEVSVLDGLRQHLKGKAEVIYSEGCRIHEGIQGGQGWWEDGVELTDPKSNKRRITAATKAARNADVAILVLGDNEQTCREAWAPDHQGDRDDINLIGDQEELLRAVVATGTPTVLILMGGRPLSICYAAEHVPAILQAWYLGQAGGTAIAEALFGDINPSGRLPITIPRSVGQLPAHYYQRPGAKYGLVSGTTEPLYPFGHGLSYTTFACERLRISPKRIPRNGKATVRVDVTNTGKRDGEEVVQLYIHDRVSSVTRPVKFLRGFQRTFLKAGQTKTVKFEVTPEHLAFIGRDMKRIVEPGMYDILVGPSSSDTQSVPLEVFAAPQDPST